MKLNKLRRLLLTGKPQADESLVGFILRLTEKNGYPRLRWILELAGIRNVATDCVCSFVFNEKTDFTSLAQVVGVESDELAQLSFPPAPNSDYATPKRLIFGNPVPPHAIRIYKTKICPRCLSESSYCRKIWHLAPVTTCPLHKCFLLSSCPQCGKHIVAYRNRVSICSCNTDWREATISSATEPELVVTRQVYKLCGLMTGELREGNLSQDNPILSLDLDHFVTALIFIGGLYRGIIDTTGKCLIPSSSNLELHLLFNKAFSVFNDWPKQFYQFLDHLREQENKALNMAGLYKDFGKLYPGLYNHLKSGSFDFMRRAFEEYLITRWDGGYALTMDRFRGAKIGARKRFISAAEAVKQLKVARNWIDRFIDDGRITAVVRKQRERRIVLIEAESVQKLKREFGQSVRTRDVARELGICPNTVPNLLKHRCLRPLRGPSVDGCPLWKFKPNAAVKLLNTIRSKITPSLESDKVNVASGAKILSTDIGDFVRAILDDEIAPCGESSGTGLLRFLFSREKLIALASTRKLIERKYLMTVRQAAQAMGLHASLVYLLVDRGFFKTEVACERGRTVTLIKRDEVEHFKLAHVRLSEYATSLGISSWTLVRLLTQKGIQPISGFSVDGSRNYIFKKADLESVDFSTMIFAKSINTPDENIRLKGSCFSSSDSNRIRQPG